MKSKLGAPVLSFPFLALKVTAALVLVFAIPSAFAQTETTSLSSPSSPDATSRIKILENKKFEEDTRITDAKLKADSGSLSKFSAKFSLSYYGPTVDDFSKKEQPNPDNGIGVYQTSLGGSIGLRYRLTSDSSLSAGTGLKALTPLHSVQRVDLNNPYLSYDRVGRYGNLQVRQSPGISIATVPNYRDVGEVGGVNYDVSTVYGIGTSRWSVSFDSQVQYWHYERPYIACSSPKQKSGCDRNASQFDLGFFPGVKYRVSDALSLVTSSSVGFWNPRRDSNERVLMNKTVTQRLGLGWAVTRDIYVNPYLNVIPTRMAWDTTTFNISSSFSLL